MIAALLSEFWPYIAAAVGAAASIFAAWVFGRSGGIQSERRKLDKAYIKTRGRVDEQDYASDDPISDVRERLRKRGER